MKRSYSHISLDERRKIERWRAAGLGVDVLAEKLGRHRSTIFRVITHPLATVHRPIDSEIAARGKGVGNYVRKNIDSS